MLRHQKLNGVRLLVGQERYETVVCHLYRRLSWLHTQSIRDAESDKTSLILTDVAYGAAHYVTDAP